VYGNFASLPGADGSHRDNLQRIVNGLHAENLALKAQLQTHENKLAQQDAKLARIERIVIEFEEQKLVN